MLEMPNGFWARFAVICAGCVLVPVLLRLVDVSRDGRGLVELLYLFAVMGYLLYFFLKHEDEIPTRSERD
jgi:hypothetical protein